MTTTKQNGPMHAFKQSLKRLGWEMDDEVGRISKGGLVQNLLEPWKTVVNTLFDQYISDALETLVKRRPRFEGVQEGVDTWATWRRQNKEGINEKWLSLARSIGGLDMAKGQ